MSLSTRSDQGPEEPPRTHRVVSGAKSRRPRYVLGGLAFRSQQEIKDHVREIKSRVRDEQPLTGQDRDVLLDLIKMNPEHVQIAGCGIVDVVVRTNNFDGILSRGFWAIRVDGTCSKFSVPECLAPESHRNKVRRAMRRAVSDQVFAYQRKALAAAASGLLVCELTGEVLSPGNCHVDHAYPMTFDVLADAFLAERGLDYSAVVLTARQDTTIGQTLADSHLAADWADYHRRNAKLRLLSPRGNCSLARGGKNHANHQMVNLSSLWNIKVTL